MSNPGQSWNNILSYIKMSLGAPLNLIEISDSDIVEMLKEHVLPVFSQYAPDRRWVLMGPDNLLPNSKLGQPLYRYKIPHPKDEPIIDVLEVMFSSYSILSQEYGMIPYNTMGAIDQVIANSYVDAIRSISVKNTWDYIPPDIISLDIALTDWSATANGIIVCNYTTIHKTLDTIRPDFYSLCFKKMCLGQTMLYLSALRSKFENLTTPFGGINLNWQSLYDQGTRLLEECNQFLITIPPDKLLEIS